MLIKNVLSVAFMCLASQIVFSQPQVSDLHQEKPAGTSVVANTDIKAKENLFPLKIYNYYIDPLSQTITLQLRESSENGKWLNNTGKIVLYDLVDNKERWVKKINYEQSNLLQDKDILIQSKENSTSRLNMETGDELWKTYTQISYIDQFTGVGIGYHSDMFGDNTNRLEAVDLDRGNTAWFRNINREYGWNDLIRLNDSVILLVAADLHTIDLKRGGGWDYDAVTGSRDYTATVIANAASIIVGALTGTYTTYNGYDVVTDIASNVWMEDTSFYFASRESMARLDVDGTTRWSCELPRKKTSKSSVFTTDSLVFVINYGYAFLDNRKVNFGKPFIAAFNKKTGRQAFQTEIDESEVQIADYILGSDAIMLLFKNKIAKYSMTNGLLISEKSIQTETTGDFTSFTSEQFFVETDSAYQSFESLEPDKLHVVTEKNKLLTINDLFEIETITEPENLFTLYGSSEELRFLKKGDETIVINNENKKVAVLQASPNAISFGAKLYDIQKNCLLEFDLSGLHQATP